MMTSVEHTFMTGLSAVTRPPCIVEMINIHRELKGAPTRRCWEFGPNHVEIDMTFL